LSCPSGLTFDSKILKCKCPDNMPYF
jgi:hypothetical protein